MAEQGFTVGVDESHVAIDIRVRWLEPASPEQVLSLWAKAAVRTNEELHRRLPEIEVD